MPAGGGARTSGPRSPDGALRLPGSAHPAARRRTGPRGRHGFPLHEVAEFRRMRLLDAFVAEVSRSGFAGAHVSQVCRAAEASTKAFYDAFASKEGCLLRAFDLGAALVCRRALAVFEVTPGPWPTRVLAAVETALRVLADNPPFARVALVEVPRLGPAGVARLDAVAARFLDCLEGEHGGVAHPIEASGTGSGTPARTGTAYHGALVAAVVCLLAERVEAGEVERLPELAPAVVRGLPGASAIRAWTARADRNIQARNAVRSFSPASAVVQLGASPDDAQ